MEEPRDRRTSVRKVGKAKGSKGEGSEARRRPRLYVPLDPGLHLKVQLWAKWSGIEIPELVANFLEEQVKGFRVEQRGPVPTPFRIANGPETALIEREAI